MGYFNQFPHTNYYQQDLGFLIEKYKELVGDYNDLVEKYDLLIKIYEIVKKDIEDITIEQLNAWLIDGTLEEIISKLVLNNHFYNYVDDMINDMLIKSNDMCVVYNYANKNDFGGSSYLIVDSIDDEYAINLKNGLYAVLQVHDRMNLHEFGIFGDGITDITTKYQKAINYVCKYGDSYLYIPSGTYMIDGVDHKKLPVDSNHLLDSGGIKILSGLTLEHDDNAIMQIIATNYQQYNLYRIYNVQNVNIKGGVLNGDRESHFGTYGGEWGYLIAISGSKNVNIENMKCQNAWGDGLNLQYLFSETTLTHEEKTCTNIYIKNVVSDMNRRQGLSLESGENINIENCEFTNTNGIPPAFGIDIEPGNSYSTVNRVYIKNCKFDGNESRHLGMYAFNETNKITNVHVSNCYFGKCYNEYKYAISMDDGTSDIYFTNNIFDFNTSNNQAHIILFNYKGNYTFKNNDFLDCTIFSSKDSNVNLIDNYIEYNASEFIELSGIGDWLIKGNICKSWKTGFILFTGKLNGSIIFMDNILNTSLNEQQIFLINASPNTPITAVNNFIGGSGTNSQVTYYAYGGAQTISNGSFSGLTSYTVRPTHARQGTMVYETNTNKLIIYTGSKWIYADGSDA